MSDKKQASRLPGDDLVDEDRVERLKQQRAAHDEARAEKTMEHDERALRSRYGKPSHGLRGNDVLFRLYKAGRLSEPPPSFPADGGETDLADQFDMGLREFHVERDDNRPLQFKGYLVGWNEIDLSVPRGTRVCVFVTRRGKIITAVHQWQRPERRRRNAAAVHDTAEEAVRWLVEDGNGRLGRASREAWDLACQVWPSLRGHEAEVVE